MTDQKQANETAPKPKPEDEPKIDFFAIATSIGLFDGDAYRAATGLDGEDRPLFRDYFRNQGKAPQGKWPGFDPEFYLDTYADVRERNMNPLNHYLRWGRGEGRYPTRGKLAADKELLENSDLFERHSLGKFAGNNESLKDPVMRYLAIGWRQGAKCLTSLDDRFYEAHYKQIMGPEFVPAIHYLKFGQEFGLIRNETQFKQAVAEISASEVFDPAVYSANAGVPFKTREEAVTHYLTTGLVKGFRCSKEFDNAIYLEAYPDLQMSRLPPILHYIRHGKREGRKAVLSSPAIIRDGGQAVHEGRASILLVCHEASATGAPMLGLALANSLKDYFNVITLLPKGGPLVDDFASASSALVMFEKPPQQAFDAIVLDIQNRFSISAAILNTAVVAPYSKAISDAGIPTIGLLHEFADYVTPKARLSQFATSLKRLIVPCEAIKLSLTKALQTEQTVPTAEISVRHQGKVAVQGRQVANPPSQEDLAEVFGLNDAVKPKIVLGAGAVQPRKGVDLFIQTAITMTHFAKDPIRFVWVGEGWDPTDMRTGVWLTSTIEALKPQIDVRFVSELPDLDWALDQSDVLLISSRLDPFPNVAIDAVTRQVPVVCYEETNGFAEFVKAHNPSSRAVRTADTIASCSAILELFAADNLFPPEEVAGITEALDWDEYVAYVMEMLMLEIPAGEIIPGEPAQV